MSLLVIEPGLLMLVQDLGRTGSAHLGVPRGGALDAAAAALANRLVGNHVEAAVVELTVTGARFTAECAVTLATAGSRAEIRVDGRHRGFGQAVWVPAGASIDVGPAQDGLRTYLAARGGFAISEVLGSRSTDTLGWIGPGPVRTGDRLPIGCASGEVPAVEAPAPRRWHGVLRVWPGPRWDWLTASAQKALMTAEFEVAPDSDRVAMRLLGAPLERAVTGELPSEGIPDGGIQVPPSGQPLIFLADHPVTGGYPVVAVVDPHDLDWCAQLRPGTVLRFARARGQG
ncbi:MAG: biotin-dependent carboxyltransferase family protein [Nocardioides sp.]